MLLRLMNFIRVVLKISKPISSRRTHITLLHQGCAVIAHPLSLLAVGWSPVRVRGLAICQVSFVVVREKLVVMIWSELGLYFRFSDIHCHTRLKLGNLLGWYLVPELLFPN